MKFKINKECNYTFCRLSYGSTGCGTSACEGCQRAG